MMYWSLKLAISPHLSFYPSTIENIDILKEAMKLQEMIVAYALDEALWLGESGVNSGVLLWVFG